MLNYSSGYSYIASSIGLALKDNEVEFSTKYHQIRNLTIYRKYKMVTGESYLILIHKHYEENMMNVLEASNVIYINKQ